MTHLLFFVYVVGLVVGLVAAGYYDWFNTNDDTMYGMVIMFWPFFVVGLSVSYIFTAPVLLGAWLKKRKDDVTSNL